MLPAAHTVRHPHCDVTECQRHCPRPQRSSTLIGLQPTCRGSCHASHLPSLTQGTPQLPTSHTRAGKAASWILRLPADGLLLLLLRRRQVELRHAIHMGATLSPSITASSCGGGRQTPSRPTLDWDHTFHTFYPYGKSVGFAVVPDLAPALHEVDGPPARPRQQRPLGQTLEQLCLSGPWSLALCFPIVAQYSSLAHPPMAVKTEGRSAEG
ncbi:hypothetical protein JMJ77_0011139 [Colletotrichum scovillei]|uniref:Uncharacterized protein n=1 Tax=Colletotrichum scovillei TaxID=1209932 RepID=A0A9P7UDF7_9PEZI|nr:hypothetical protein JMJ77_0011139 [Colletotrichum scovillei]KAG7060116.1 hypothetical protein JMJ78_0015395 [Colletotrichum scovillei]KAG7067564.1 hypothetical protein JMJ76_0008996 [Colletotrichum scovillei]